MFTKEFKRRFTARSRKAWHQVSLLLAGGILYKVAVPDVYRAVTSGLPTSPFALLRALGWPCMAILIAIPLYFGAARGYGKAHSLWKRAIRRYREKS